MFTSRIRSWVKGRRYCLSTWFSHVEARWDFPGFAYYLRRLASFSRVISFDKRGIGLSILFPSTDCRSSRSG